MNIILDLSGVGTDLRPPPALPTSTSATLPPVFLKPAGFDAPQRATAPKAGSLLSRHVESEDDYSAPDIIPGARKKSVKRERADTGDGEGKKRRKKSNSQPAAP